MFQPSLCLVLLLTSNSALYVATELQLAGDGENDKGRFLGHNGLRHLRTREGGRESREKYLLLHFNLTKFP